MTLYRIFWKSKTDPDFHGQGAYTLPKEVAEKVVRDLNLEYEYLEHWLEPVKEKEDERNI